MNIHKIIYETTRSLINVEDKLRITTLILFCYKIDDMTFAELLYTDDREAFIRRLSGRFHSYDIDLNLRLSDKNVRDCFANTIEKVREKYDNDGFYKAIYEGDPFALAIINIVEEFSRLKSIKK